MKRSQWFAFAVGTSILGSVFWTLAFGWHCSPLTMGEMYTACVIKQQSYAIPAMFCSLFALIFFVCGWLEGKARH